MARSLLAVRSITILAGIIFLSLITAVNFSVYHATALHIDSADQSLAVLQVKKIKKLLPVPDGILPFVFLVIRVLIHSIFTMESFPATYTPYDQYPPRSPPAVA